MPETALELTTEAPRPPQPPRTGAFDSTKSRYTELVVDVQGKIVTVGAWCRVGVWTSLDAVEPREFIVREAWGRLGKNPPRLLTRIYDQALAGVVARMRPEADGTLSFHVEIAAAADTGRQDLGDYHGQPVSLVTMRRHGYRFHGRAKNRYRGVVARWGSDVSVHLGDAGALPSSPVRFRAGSTEGFVVGSRVEAETFVEEWLPGKPIHIQADGIERKDFRLIRRRSASGFRPRGEGWQTYGAAFDVRR